MMINSLFASTLYSEVGQNKALALRQDFTFFLERVEELLPGNSRELSIIRTKLEEASFYAIKALRNYEENRA